MNPEDLDAIKVSQGVTVQELAEALDVPANDIIKRLFLLGQPMDAAALLQMGWLDGAVAADALDTAVDGLVAALLAGAPLALLGMKRSLDEIARGEFDLARLRAREAACAASADLREGMAAMAARRPPRFSGR